jgi:hypothetical protein
MRSNDSDLVLVSIAANDVLYGRPVNDPVFSAHMLKGDARQVDNRTRYKSDSPFQVIGCQQQVKMVFLMNFKSTNGFKVSILYWGHRWA